MLSIKNLSAGYGKENVLNNINMDVPPGKITVLFGPNGCGKSTLLKTICGILPIKDGEILLDSENLLELDSKNLAQRVTYLAQSRQISDITVRRLVLHGRFPYLNYPRRYRKEDYEMAERAMEAMQVLDLADIPLEQLSGGQRQKVYIAMALAQDTPVVMLDEPTTYLDIRHQVQLLQSAKDLAKKGKTVLMIVHDIDRAMNVADHIVLLEEGKVITQGTPEEVFQSQKIEEVFGVKIKRLKTEKSWRYFSEEI